MHIFSNAGLGKHFGIGHELDPAGTAIRAITGSPTTPRTIIDPAGVVLKAPQYVPPAPTAPTQDTAANAARQMQDQMRRRRGVYGNIFAGNAATPAVAKTALGN